LIAFLRFLFSKKTERKGGNMNYPIYFNDSYVVPGGGLETIRKADRVAARIAAQFPHIDLVSPKSATTQQLLLAHSVEYVESFLTGEPRWKAEAGLGEWSAEVVTSVLASTGGVIEAALSALDSGKSGSLSSGLHHAAIDHGAGFCTINGLAIAALVALQNGATTVGILDLDAHCGGGTFDIIGGNPAIRIGDLSTSTFDSWRSDETRHRLVTETDPTAYLGAVVEMLDHVAGVDLLLFNAGMDPVQGGGAGSTFGFTPRILEQREQLVAQWCERTDTPVAFVLAGGYIGSSLSLDDVADLHMYTVAAIEAVSINR
jgi:acetoin utilization deacetylase AcuC-like enzyme